MGKQDDRLFVSTEKCIVDSFQQVTIGVRYVFCCPVFIQHTGGAWDVRPQMGVVGHGCLIPTTRGVCKESVDPLEWVNTKHYTSRPLGVCWCTTSSCRPRLTTVQMAA